MEADCTCKMDGSFRLSCPLHGVRNTLIRNAHRKILTLTSEQLRKFCATDGPRNKVIKVLPGGPWNPNYILSLLEGTCGNEKCDKVYTQGYVIAGITDTGWIGEKVPGWNPPFRHEDLVFLVEEID